MAIEFVKPGDDVVLSSFGLNEKLDELLGLNKATVKDTDPKTMSMFADKHTNVECIKFILTGKR